MTSMITTKNLTKEFQTFKKEEGLKGSIKALIKKEKIMKTALKDFNLEIEEGDFVGLIGPNRAGKTTLIKLLSGVIHPTRGEASVLGYSPHQLMDGFKKQFAVVMGQKSQLWWDLPAVDTFLLNKRIYEIRDSDYKNNLALFTKLFELEDLMNIQVRNLSLGERMKMELVAALLHDPKVLFLDEPTIGLDAVAQKQIRYFLKEVNKEKGVTIILTSHYMEDIKYLCKRAIVVRKGAKIYDGELSKLLGENQIYRTIKVSFETPTEIEIDEEVEWVEKKPFKAILKVEKSKVKAVLQTLMFGYEIDDIEIEDEDIGSVVEKIYNLKAGDTL